MSSKGQASKGEKSIMQTKRDLEEADSVGTLLSPDAPSHDAANPLSWPLWVKIMVLTQVSLLAALGGLNTATINPALVDLGEEFGISTVTASYQTTVCIALNGVAPWLWIPLANKYGRRPIYLFTTFLGFASILGCAYATSFGTLIVARVFNGFFPVAFALGASTVTDLFFSHQRGRAMGFFTVIMTTGAHFAPILGGLVGGYLGWRWIFKVVSIIDAIMFITSLFCLPETLYIQAVPPQDVVDGHPAKSASLSSSSVQASSPTMTRQTYLKHLTLLSPFHHSLPPLQPLRFLLNTLSISWYPYILLPALYYATQYGFASILPAVTVAAIFSEAYHWQALTIGLTYGTALTLGGILGECFAGWIVDGLLIRAQRRHRGSGKPGSAPPEVRLTCIWPGEILVPAALLIYGFTLHYHHHVHWFAPIFAIGLGCFGLQIITTTCYTYAIDCYKQKSAEVAQMINFTRQIIGMTFAFYAKDLGDNIGFQWLFVMYAIFGSGLAFVGILLVMWKGQRWREQIEQRSVSRQK